MSTKLDCYFGQCHFIFNCMQVFITNKNLKGDTQYALIPIFTAAQHYLNLDNAIPKYMYWRFIVRCVDSLALRDQCTVTESIVTHYSCVVHSLGMVNAVSVGSQQQHAIEDPHIRLLRDQFNQWFTKLRLLFQQWRSNLQTGEIVVADTLTLKNYPKYATAGSACKVDISKELVDKVFGEFKSQFNDLKDLMLPVVRLGTTVLRSVDT